MSITAAFMASGLLAVLALFQAALAMGAPIGQFAWGAQHRVLPPNLRIGSAVAVAIYAVFALLIGQRAGLVAWLPAGVVDVGIWVVLTYLALGTVANAISRSVLERLTMTPVCLVLAGLVLIVAMGW